MSVPYFYRLAINCSESESDFRDVLHVQDIQIVVLAASDDTIVPGFNSLRYFTKTIDNFIRIICTFDGCSFGSSQ